MELKGILILFNSKNILKKINLKNLNSKKSFHSLFGVFQEFMLSAHKTSSKIA